MNDSKRIMFAALGSVLILFAWNEFFMPKKGKAGPAAAKGAQGATGPAGARPPPPPATPAAPPPAARGRALGPRGDRRPRDARVPGHLHELGRGAEEPHPEGGDLPEAGQGRGPRRAHRPRARPRGGALAARARCPRRSWAAAPMPGPTRWSARPCASSRRTTRSVTFEGRLGGVDVRKTFQVGATPLPDRRGARRWEAGDKAGTLAILYPAFQAPDAPTAGFFSGGEVFESVIPVCRAGDKTERFDGKEALKVLPGPPRWLGLDQHYFVSALMPQSARGELLLRQAAHRRGEPGRAAHPGGPGRPGHLPALRRPQADRPPARLRARPRDRHRLRPGLQLLRLLRPHPALGDAEVLLLRPQLGRGHHPPHPPGEGPPLSTDREVDDVDAGDEEAPAQGGRAQGQVRGRQGEDEPGGHEALPGAQGEPTGRVPAAAPPDAGVAGALRHPADLGGALPAALPVGEGPDGLRPVLHPAAGHGRRPASSCRRSRRSRPTTPRRRCCSTSCPPSSPSSC